MNILFVLSLSHSSGRYSGIAVLCISRHEYKWSFNCSPEGWLKWRWWQVAKFCRQKNESYRKRVRLHLVEKAGATTLHCNSIIIVINIAKRDKSALAPFGQKDSTSWSHGVSRCFSFGFLLWTANAASSFTRLFKIDSIHLVSVDAKFASTLILRLGGNHIQSIFYFKDAKFASAQN